MKKFDASSYDKHVNMSGNNVLAACDEYLAKATKRLGKNKIILLLYYFYNIKSRR